MAEILASLALVMLCASLLLAGLLAYVREREVRALVVRSFALEALHPGRGALVPGTRWFEVDASERVRARDDGAALDDEGRALAVEARRTGATLYRVERGLAAERVRFAMPLDASGRVAVAEASGDALPGASRGPELVALLVALANAAVFTLFGASLLRARVVEPLLRLLAATRALGAGEHAARVPVAGTREVAQLAGSFNAMAESLETRTDALQKAVGDLRAANRDLRAAEVGLARADRLAAVGRLAAGVAHEVGNPMGALLSFVEVAARDPGLSEGSSRALERAARQGERVRAILGQLLDFSRPPAGAPAELDLAALSSEMLELVRAQRRFAGLELDVEVASGTPRALADAGATAQIVLNLVLNAADAVVGAGRRPGRVRIRIGPAALVARADDLVNGAVLRETPDAVLCQVDDDGTGIAEEDRERIFDPFFSTKAPGEGTGLGLANASRLAEQQGGRLSVLHEGTLGGASLALWLPAARTGDVPHTPSATDCAVRSGMRGSRSEPRRQQSAEPQAAAKMGRLSPRRHAPCDGSGGDREGDDP